jgi:hypothetical protein
MNVRKGRNNEMNIGHDEEKLRACLFSSSGQFIL